MHRSHGLQHLRHKRPTFAFMRESGYTLGFRRRIAHSGLHAETGAFPPSSTAGLCAACEIALSAAFVTLIPQRFYIHTFPGSLWPPTISNSSTSDHLSSRFSTSPANGPRSLSRVKAGTHSARLKGSHTAAYTPKQGAFRMGVVSLLSERSARSPTSPGRVSERQTLPLLGLGRVYARRTQKACGTAMRLCASLFRGVAAPLGCVIFLFLSKLWLVCPALRAFCVCEVVVPLPSVCSACC